MTIDGHPNRWEDVTEIIDGVFLGDVVDAKEFKGAKICVHENPDVFQGGVRIPIMVGHRADCFMASRLMLDAATSAMRHFHRMSIPVLVHCHGGVERSPLTMAWFLKRYGFEKSLPAAYKKIIELRPIVQDRLHWLQPRDQMK